MPQYSSETCKVAGCSRAAVIETKYCLVHQSGFARFEATVSHLKEESRKPRKPQRRWWQFWKRQATPLPDGDDRWIKCPKCGGLAQAGGAYAGFWCTSCHKVIPAPSGGKAEAQPQPTAPKRLFGGARTDPPQQMPPLVDRALGPRRVAPLHDGIEKGDDHTFQLITDWVKSGGNIEWKDPNGWTLLHLAARFGNEKMVRWLLSNGADISARSGRNETPL